MVHQCEEVVLLEGELDLLVVDSLLQKDHGGMIAVPLQLMALLWEGQVKNLVDHTLVVVMWAWEAVVEMAMEWTILVMGCLVVA